MSQDRWLPGQVVSRQVREDVPRVTTPEDLGSLDRLEQKVKMLVATVGRLQGEQARLVEENRRLSGELDAARARVEEAEGGLAEAESLRQERDQVRARVAGMLEQLEGLDL